MLVALACGLLAAPLAAQAQQAARVPRIGFLSVQTGAGHLVEPFTQGLREFGHSDYKDFVVDVRLAGQDLTLLPRLATELIRLNVDVIVAESTLAAVAAKAATSSIPIVAIADDPVGSGLVASLARPGANLTGLSTLSAELGAKRVELLKEAVPKAARVAVFWTRALTAEAVGLD